VDKPVAITAYLFGTANSKTTQSEQLGAAVNAYGSCFSQATAVPKW